MLVLELVSISRGTIQYDIMPFQSGLVLIQLEIAREEREEHRAREGERKREREKMREGVKERERGLSSPCPSTT